MNPDPDDKYIICSASNGLNINAGSVTRKRPPIFLSSPDDVIRRRDERGIVSVSVSMPVPVAVSLSVYASVSWSVGAKRRRKGREGTGSERTRERQGLPYIAYITHAYLLRRLQTGVHASIYNDAHQPHLSPISHVTASNPFSRTLPYFRLIISHPPLPTSYCLSNTDPTVLATHTPYHNLTVAVRRRTKRAEPDSKASRTPAALHAPTATVPSATLEFALQKRQKRAAFRHIGLVSVCAAGHSRKATAAPSWGL